jgi:hypothetical protein
MRWLIAVRGFDCSKQQIPLERDGTCSVQMPFKDGVSTQHTPGAAGLVLSTSFVGDCPCLGASPLEPQEQTGINQNPEVRHDGLQQLPGPHLPEVGRRW